MEWVRIEQHFHSYPAITLGRSLSTKWKIIVVEGDLKKLHQIKVSLLGIYLGCLCAKTSNSKISVCKLGKSFIYLIMPEACFGAIGNLHKKRLESDFF